MIKSLLFRGPTFFKQQLVFKQVYRYSEKEQLDFRKKSLSQDKQQQKQIGYETNCMVLHPIFFPNKGPLMELYLAEEAVGLAKSLDWNVQKGPYWKEEYDKKVIQLQKEEEEEEEEEQQTEHVEVANYKSKNKRKRKNPKEDNRPKLDEGWEYLDQTNIKDGDYIYTHYFKGTYYKNGIIVDDQSDTEDDGDMFHEWRNKILRESIAKSSLIKMKNVIGKSFFTKGKLMDIGIYIKDNSIDCVFLNTELTPTQHKNLERLWTGIVNGREDEVFFKKNPMMSSDTEAEGDEPIQTQDYDNSGGKKIRVFDRFTMILQIFAKRAQTQIARHQIEVCFLNYLKTKLQREGGTTFNAMYNIFKGDLMAAQEISLEVVSAKSRAAKGKVQGEGETQLELQRRLVNDKLSKIKKELSSLVENQNFLREKRKKQYNNVPTIALIGYTNAGKSALMNSLIRKDVVESKDNLFQTLSTTSRKFKLISGQQAILLDTIGFITDLPHELVDSFQSTLMEVEHADLVLHVRDISHPHTEDQKKTVLKVLKQLGFDQQFYTNKMIEVWNKMDLLEENVDYQSALKSDFPVVPVSALYNTNIKKLTQTLEQKVNHLMNKKYYTIVNPLNTHEERYKWLFANANISRLENEQYDYKQTKQYPYGNVKFQVLLDDVTFRRYCHTFNIQVETQDNKKGMPPKEWLKGSESYFQRMREQKEKEDLNFLKNKRED
ncbi:hypothetical protein ABPG72_021388 [Tetrahymena utriculariae]